MRHRLTERAERDVADILRETRRLFGPRQLLNYAALLDRAIIRVADQPATPGSRERPELGQGVRSFLIALAGRRLSAGAHLLYYLEDATPNDGGCLIILRVLHEAMEPKRRVMAAAREERS